MISSQKLKKSKNLAAIRFVKRKLKKISVKEVAEFLDCTRSNIYYHLDEKKAANVSIVDLNRIADAIDQILDKKQKIENKILKKLTPGNGKV